MQPKAGLPVLGLFRSVKSRNLFRKFNVFSRLQNGLHALALLVDLNRQQEGPVNLCDHSSRSISPSPRR